MCSVSVSKNGELVYSKEINNGYTHAENLHLFIEEVLKESSIDAKELAGIAVSKGPGSYTGLRIGVSAAKGLAYALNIPLISVDTLEIMANEAQALKQEDAFYCPMIDARRMEVYTAVYDNSLSLQTPIQALIVDENSILTFKRFSTIYFFGDGMPKCKEVLSLLPHAKFVEEITPSSKFMCDLAFKKYVNKDFADVAYFEPFYLKDFLILQKDPKKG